MRVLVLIFLLLSISPTIASSPIIKVEQVRIISVDFRETSEETGAFLKKIPVDFPVLLDRALNRDGKEVIEIIDELLAEP